MLEAIGYIANRSSFRHSPREALVRSGRNRAIIRAGIAERNTESLIEVEIDPKRRDVVQWNHQRTSRAQQSSGTLQVTVFTPDDLVLVKEGPSGRRQYLDEILANAHPKIRSDLTKMERVLRQRNVLLRQSVGRLTAEISSTLDVWDVQLAEVGTRIVNARRELVSRIAPRANSAFQQLTRSESKLEFDYQSSYAMTLYEALLQARTDDVRRGMSTLGPHRDDLSIYSDDLDARTRLSQGRQRAITLSLRLAAHDYVTEVSGQRPVLLLDDVFSELDTLTSEALFAELPPGQTLLTTAGVLPATAEAHHRVMIERGELR